jgi:hypothetical protein
MKFDPFATAEMTRVVQFWRGRYFVAPPGSVVNLDVAVAFRCSVTSSEQPFSFEEITANEDSKRNPTQWH